MKWLEEIVMGVARSVGPWTWSDEAKAGLELERYRAKDFRPMEEHFRKTFPSTHQRIQPRYVSLSSKVAQDGAGQYIQSANRIFPGSSTQQQILDELYARLRVNETLLRAEQQGVLQQSYLLGYWPDLSGQPRLHVFLPYQIVRLEWDDPWAQVAGDMSGASLVELAVPLKTTSETGASKDPSWAMRVILTRTEAWTIMPNGEARGIFTPGGGHALGRVPLELTCREAATDGGLPTVAHDVRSCQIGIVLILSDCEDTVRHSLIVALLASGAGAALLPDSIPLQAGRITKMPGEVTVTAVHQNPPIESLLKCGALAMSLITRFRNLRPQGYDASIITGRAAEIDREGFLEERRRQELRCESLEQRLLDLVVDVHALLPRASRLKRGKLSVRHRYIRSRENVLQEAQATSVLIAKNLWSVVEEVAEQEGLSTDRAVELLQRRAEWNTLAPMVDGKVDGLDKSVP